MSLNAASIGPPSPLTRTMKLSRRRISALLVGLGLAASSLAAHAEGQIRIAQQFGISYLLLHVVQDQKLIEKHGKAQGLAITPQWLQLSGGAAINDALLSGSIDIGGAGIGPMLTLWDRTKGRQNVRGVASLGNTPYYLISTNPNVRTVADLTEKDRVALPAVGVSVQSRYLQLAAAKRWGDGGFNKLDKFTVTLPHPEAVAAIVRGGTEVNAHFATPPFQEQELAANPKARVILNSYDVLGGPSSPNALYATEAFRTQNPKTYRAFVQALADASKLIAQQPELAADIYLRVNHAKLDRELLLKVIRSPEVQFSLTPQNTFVLADFMARVGAIRNRPASVQDYFFADAHLRGGS